MTVAGIGQIANIHLENMEKIVEHIVRQIVGRGSGNFVDKVAGMIVDKVADKLECTAVGSTAADKQGDTAVDKLGRTEFGKGVDTLERTAADRLELQKILATH